MIVRARRVVAMDQTGWVGQRLSVCGYANGRCWTPYSLRIQAGIYVARCRL